MLLIFSDEIFAFYQKLFTSVIKFEKFTEKSIAKINSRKKLTDVQWVLSAWVVGGASSACESARLRGSSFASGCARVSACAIVRNCECHFVGLLLSVDANDGRATDTCEHYEKNELCEKNQHLHHKIDQR